MSSASSRESKWQEEWEKSKVFETDPDPSRPSYFVTVAYPYPNSPQHIGHCRTYSLADVHARYMRMRGYNVLFPMAFHYTGTPVISMSKRLIAKDQELIDEFVDIYNVPADLLKDFEDPLNMARYFHKEIKTGMKDMGYSFDWRREFTTIDPQYNRFIEWQFRKLHGLGHVIRGSHPVGWCPSDENPVGQHDTRHDVEPEIGEFTLIKFRFDDGYHFPTATLRAETVFGVTNVWVNPSAWYVKATVDGEPWVTSKKSVDKLRLLNRKVEVETEFRGSEIVGKHVTNPLTGERILVFPATFVDPGNATGNVMSVPGHAPYDYVALRELKKNVDELAKYNIPAETVSSIEPIPVIEVEGYGEIPSADVVDRMKITTQSDQRLEEATKEIYASEFHAGRMRSTTGKYAGMPTEPAREQVVDDMIKESKADKMYELLNRPVFCRCGTECVVKIFSDQFFIDYGNAGWKDKVRRHMESMQILPEELRAEFQSVVDWLKAKACARKTGLGTKLPWDKSWIIEALSDSTIYMAYYTISKYINDHKIKAEQLTDAVFSYIFLGEGDPRTLSVQTGLDLSLLKKMRDEFGYFYPLSSRHSGRDLVWNHLTYFVFNHVAIFPPALWPKQIVVNGFVLMEGQKMSKSLENIIPLRDAIDQYGTDALRLSVLSTAGLLQDVDFSRDLARSMGRWIERFHAGSLQLIDAYRRSTAQTSNELTSIGRWLISRLQRHIERVTEAMSELDVQKAITRVTHQMDREIQWYLRRVSNGARMENLSAASLKTLYDVLDVRIRLLAPFAPHVCEELWHAMGMQGFVSVGSWPAADRSKIDPQAEVEEMYLMKLVEDLRNIVKVIKGKPKVICVYAASPWKQDVSKTILSVGVRASLREPGAAIKKAVSIHPEKKSEAPEVVKKTVEALSGIPTEENVEAWKRLCEREYSILEDACQFIRREFDAEVSVMKEGDPGAYDPGDRARHAVSLRPAIYIET